MIRAENLTKTYITKKTKCEALKNVSFVLPEKGLVFIVGKSGSGKSTLLNMLGGLDKMTSGDVIADGKRFSEFSVKDFDNFRNEKLGFIFQDFCLIENLTVRENVELVLDLQTREDYDTIERTLEAVGLEDLGNRFPKELSAGQKQRVAIARALVKNTKIILADEPTGNIDSKSSQAVLEILKEISADRLVVIISHNNDDAKKYADRIIEIGDGEIINDVTREDGYDNRLCIEDDAVLLPYDKALSEDEIKEVNKRVLESKGRISFRQRTSGFGKTEQPEDTGSLGAYESKGLKPKKIFKYAAAFFKKRRAGAALTAVIISFLMIVFGMAQLFTIFDGSEQIKQSVEEHGDNGIILRQGYFGDEYSQEIKKNRLVEIKSNNYDAVVQSYEGKIYRMYKVNIPVSHKNYLIDSFRPLSLKETFRKGFANESNGVLVCDFDYLKHFYGDEEGNLKVLTGEIKTYGDGVIITDYIADSLIYYNGDLYPDYESIANEQYLNSRLKVDAIIESGYKDKYAWVFEYLLKNKKLDYKDASLADFVDDVMNRLSVCFSLNPDFKTDYVDAFCNAEGKNDWQFAHAEYLSFESGESETSGGHTYGNFSQNVADDEIYIGVDYYNALFGTDFTAEDISDLDQSVFEGKTVRFKIGYGYGDEIYFDREFKIVGLQPSGHFRMSKTYLHYLKSKEIIPFQLYFENSDNAMDIINSGENAGMYLVGNTRYSLIKSIATYVIIFKDIFLYIAIAVCAVIVFLLALNSFNNIKRSSYEIGVIRSMGGRTGQVSAIFMIQTLATGLLICLLTAIGSYLGVLLFNNVLIESISQAAKIPGIAEISILTYNPAVVAVDVGIILILTVLSVIVPILAVRKIQPIQIIRARE